MFRIRDPQESLWQSQFLVTPKKAKRLERSWAEVFRNEALPLIDEERFAPMYCVDNGRPNRAVQTVLGVHLLKEMFNLTDQEALEQLEFNLLWHHALRLDIEETHLPQKTLHNFRVRLMQHDGGRLAFQETTDRIIQALGIRTGKQRLDSTHIMSNIATLTRLGLFCETMRLFLRALRWEHPELRPGVPEGLLVLQRREGWCPHGGFFGPFVTGSSSDLVGHQVDCGLPGHSHPRAQQKSSAHGDASEVRVSYGLRRFSPSQTPFLLCQGQRGPTGYPPEHWVVPAVPFGRRPSGFRRACACWSVAPSGR